MKKHLLTFSLTVLLAALLSLSADGAGGGGVSILVDGAPLEAPQGAYITEGGVTMAPLRALSEALGFYVAWDGNTRTVSITTEPAEASLSGVVVLDPGHGGGSTGAAYGGVSEKDLNLSIAQKTASLLEEAGLTAVLTRTDDRDVGLYERTGLASEQNADIFVSIHCNASLTNPSAAGIYTASYSRGDEGWALSELLRQTMTEAAGAADMGGEERPDLAVLRTAAMPAALVECGYMSTPEELALLVRPEYQDSLARGIADGIIAYLTPGA